MIFRTRDRLKFHLERWLLRGVYVRLLFMAMLVGVCAVAGGSLIAGIEKDFEHVGAAIWWAFLRLTDPGYLGDDQGVAKRIISTVLTILGYVLFMGSLVAVMTQWLNSRIRELELGMTPIFQKEHVLVLGWTSRTATIAREMFAASAEELQRFLALRKSQRSRVHLVLLVEQLSAELRQSLREQLGVWWRESQVTMRSGSPLVLEHLQRVDYLRAAAILLPAEDVGPDEQLSDARTIKALRSIDTYSASHKATDLPLVVAEVFDWRKINIAKRAYRGPLEVVATDQVVGRMLALSLKYPGMSLVLEELLASDHGPELGITEAGTLMGKAFGQLDGYFPRSIPLGVVRPRAGRYEAILCPAADAIIEPKDRIVLLSNGPPDRVPQDTARPAVAAPEPDAAAEPTPTSRPVDRLLILGWSDRVPDVLAELAAHGVAQEVDVVGAVSEEDRAVMLAEHDVGDLRVRNVHADVTSPVVVRRWLAEDHERVLLMASDWLGSYAESDARTLLTRLVVDEVCEDVSKKPHLVVELMQSASEKLIRTQGVDAIVSPEIVGQMLAHITLRRELHAVYLELLDAEGPVLSLKEPSYYQLGSGKQHSFAQLRAAVARDGDVLLGIFHRSVEPQVRLNPSPERSLSMDDDIRLIVARRGSGSRVLR